MYSLTGSRGALILAVANATGDYSTTLTNGDPGSSCVITLPATTTTLSGLAVNETMTGNKVITGTLDIRGAVSSGASNPNIVFSGSSGTFVTCTGNNTLSGHVTVAAGKNFTMAVGAGIATFNGATSGSIVISPADAGTNATTIVNSGGGSAKTITLPTATCTLSGIGLAETFSAVKTFTAAPIVSIDAAAGVTTVATIGKTNSGGAGAGNDGLKLSFIVENATDATTEVASIQFVNTTATKATCDTDVIISTMLGGAVSQAIKIDAANQQVVIGVSAADADGINTLRIFPHTTAARGSLVFTSSINGTGDFATTVTQATTVSEAQTITIPDAAGATDTFALIGTAQTWTATQTIRALTASAGVYNMDFSASTGTFLTCSGENTLSGNVTISGAKTFSTGTGAVSINGVTTFGNTTGIVMSGTITTGINLTGTISDGIRFNPVYVGQAIVIDGGTATDTGTIGTAIQIGLTGTKLTLTTADQSAIKAYVTTSATSGDNRLAYLNYTLSAAGGGECLRALTNLTASVSVARGAHISLVPSGSGNVTGQGAALCATLHYPDAGLGGYVAAVQAQIYPESGSTNAALPAYHGLLWLDVVTGNDDAQAAKVLNAMLVVTPSNCVGNKAAALMISNADVTVGGGASAGGIAINVNGTRMWLATYAIA